MNTFFDLREFMITLLRKSKFILTVVIVMAILCGMVRFVPLMISYINYSAPDVVQLEDEIKNFPYRYQSRKTIYIPPQYMELEGNVVDENKKVLDAYIACYQNREILQPLIDEFFTDSSIVNQEYLKKLYEYNYVTKARLERIYTLRDFYSIVSIRIDNNFVHVYATSGSEELSAHMVERAESLITKYVIDLVGSYEYQITDGQVGYIEPIAEDGLIPKPLVYAGSNSIDRPELSFIIKRSIKGVIWGVAGGIGISILFVFFFHCINIRIASENDLEIYNVDRLLSIKIPNKKRWFGFIDSWIDYLEGNKNAFLTYNDAAKFLYEFLQIKLKGLDNIEGIVLTGAGDSKYVELLVEALTEINQSKKQWNYVKAVPSITKSPDAIHMIAENVAVVMVEEIGNSEKEEIRKEIENMNYIGRCPVGMVLMK